MLIETDMMYQLRFPKVNDIDHSDLKYKLDHFDFGNPAGLYHYEFIFDPYTKVPLTPAELQQIANNRTRFALKGAPAPPPGGARAGGSTAHVRRFPRTPFS